MALIDIDDDEDVVLTKTNISLNNDNSVKAGLEKSINALICAVQNGQECKELINEAKDWVDMYMRDACDFKICTDINDSSLQDIIRLLLSVGIYNFNWLDTKNITDMSDIFTDIIIPDDESLHIEDWNTSNVTTFRCMFMNSNINCDLSKWVTNKVADISFMFKNNVYFTYFDSFKYWDMSKVLTARNMLTGSYIPADIFINHDIKLRRCKDIFAIKQDTK